MKRTLAVLCTLLGLALAPPASSRTIERVHVPEKVRVLGGKAVLNGATKLEVTFLGFDVSVIALYLRTRESDAEKLLKGESMWYVRMTYLREIGRDEFREGWRDAFAERPERNAPGMDAVVDRLLGVIPEVHIGDLQTLAYDPKAGLAFAVNGKVLFKTKDRTFARMLLRGFVDSRFAMGGIAPRLLGK